MRRTVKRFVTIVSNHFQARNRIVEFGARRMPGQETFANLRPLFPNASYLATDYLPGPGVDQVLDIRDINLPDQTVDIAICTEVLEHVDLPFVAARELFRVLKADGILILTVPMKLKIHGSPHDYWRFTPSGVRTLLTMFENVATVTTGHPDYPDHVMCVAQKGFPLSRALIKDLADFEDSELSLFYRVSRHRFAQCLRLLIPIAFLDSNFEFFLRTKHPDIFSKIKHFIWLMLPELYRRLR